MEPIEPQNDASKSSNVVADNISQLAALFPAAITEGKIDFEVLRQLLGDSVDESDERYGLTWHGKRQALQLAQTPSTGTLRPCPQDSVGWDTTKNLMIEGDNLEVLKLMQKSYAGRVKLIYIDPPYNTGKDFVYKDNYRDNIKNYLEQTGQTDEEGHKTTSNTEASGRYHTDWLNMMYPRLKAAHTLLREDGSIFIASDEAEVMHIRLLGNLVFGEAQYVTTLTVLCNPKGRSHDMHFATNHEYLTVFSRRPLPKGAFSLPKTAEEIAADYPEYDADGPFRYLELRNTHREFGRNNRANLWYPLYVDTRSGVVSLKSSDTTQEVLPVWPDGYEGCWTWGKDKVAEESSLLAGREVNGAWKVYRKSYAEGSERMLKTILNDASFTTEHGQRAFDQLFPGDERLFQAPKSPSLLQTIVKAASKPGDVVCDFFAGSGTIGAAIMALNPLEEADRHWVLVQLPERLSPDLAAQTNAAAFCERNGLPLLLSELTKERLRRAAAKVAEENPDYKGDLGFRVFKLDSSNIREWDENPDDLPASLEEAAEHVKADRTDQDVLYELLLKQGIDLCVPIGTKEIAGHTVQSVGGGTLITCLGQQISQEDTEPLGLGIANWHKELKPAGETTCIFRDSAFPNDIAKTNLTAILNQHNITTIRSI